MNELMGRMLGPYQIVQPLGQGGMASVYKAYQAPLQRYVAIKILPEHLAQDKQFSERFAREARAVAHLDHPNILPVYDYGQIDDITYIVMKYVEGGTLKDWLARGKMPFDQAATILGQVASALDYAHSKGVVHRDVKPANILMARPDWALLSDFGLAKVAEATVQLTGTGVGMGTPEYMAPEQATGGAVDARADIYALGVTLYAMVTGQPPYSGGTPIEVILKHVNDPLPSPRAVVPSLPPAAEAAILKAMAKKPEDRPFTATELSDAFSRAVQAKPEAEAGATRLETSMPPAESGRTAPRPSGGATVLEAGAYSQYPQATMPPPPISSPPISPPAGVPLGGPAPAARPAAGGGRSWLWVAIALGLLLVCGVVLAGGAALGGLMAFGQPTATPTTTPLPPTPTNTNTPLPPTATETPSPSPTPAVTTLFQDDFSSQTNGWTTYSGSNSTAAYGSGDFMITQSRTNWFSWTNPDNANLSLSNIHIEVTARSTGAAAEPGLGIICDYQDTDNYYYMGISVDGYYIIARTVAGTDKVLTDTDSWIKSDAIPHNADSYRLGADCGNGSLSLSVNGTTLATVSDSTFSQGTIGLFARSFDQTNVEIDFDDVVVTALGSGS